MLIIGQPHKMLRDVRSIKGSRELSSTLMEILGSGENHNVSNLVFSLCMSDCLAKFSDTAMSLLHCSPAKTSYRSNLSVVRIVTFCILCFTLYVRVLGQVFRYSNVTASLLPSQNFLQRQPQPVGTSYHFVMQSSGSQYLQKTCSPSPTAL